MKEIIYLHFGKYINGFSVVIERMLPTQLIERPNATAVYYLHSKLSNEFWAQHYMKDEDFTKKQSIALTKKYLEECIKNNCIVRADYKPSKFDKNNLLRLYGDGIQNIPSRFRGLLFGENTVDVDIINCHPSILRHLCQINEYNCPQLDNYCENRKKIIDDKLATKNEIVISMYMSESVMTYSPFLKLFDAEMKALQKLFYDNERYEFIKKTVNISKKNPIGTFLSYLLQYHERLIISCVCNFFEENNIEICSQMFDGCMVYGDFNDIESLEKYIFEKSSFPAKFAIKPHSNLIEIPDDFEYETNEDKYLTMKKKYENEFKLCYIAETSTFVISDGGKVLFKSKTDMTTHLEAVYYDDDETEHFFSKWLKDSTRKTYSRVESIPHDRECPVNVLNIWDGFDVEKFPEVDETVDISAILNHNMIMCNHKPDAYEAMLNWEANLFKYPSQQSICPVLFTEEGGTGKSTMFRRLRNMIGIDKTLETGDVAGKLFPTFNGHLLGKVLVYIDDPSPKDMKLYHDRLKLLIDGSTLNVHFKGSDAYTVMNIAHFLGSTNNEDCFYQKKDERRYFQQECSSELMGNEEYHRKMNDEIINDKRILRAYYNFLMKRDVKKRLNITDFPISEMMKTVVKMNTDPVENFFNTIAPGSYKNKDLYTYFTSFIKSEGLQFIPAKSSFDTKFSRICKKKNIVSNKYDSIVEYETIDEKGVISKFKKREQGTIYTFV